VLTKWHAVGKYKQAEKVYIYMYIYIYICKLANVLIEYDDIVSEISVSDGGEHEYGCLLGCCAM
jgi:hypothetical protein